MTDFNYEVSKEYTIFYAKGNINNKTFEIRAIVDGEVIVCRSVKTGKYYNEHISFLDALKKEKILFKKLSK